MRLFFHIYMRLFFGRFCRSAKFTPLTLLHELYSALHSCLWSEVVSEGSLYDLYSTVRSSGLTRVHLADSSKALQDAHELKRNNTPES
jgi:hypothetical protein